VPRERDRGSAHLKRATAAMVRPSLKLFTVRSPYDDSRDASGGRSNARISARVKVESLTSKRS